MTFAKEVTNFVLKAKGLQEKQVRFLCLELLKGVVLGTPVDKRPARGGRARGNWQASISTAASGTIDRKDPGGGATISAGKDAIQKAPGTVFYITNNLPYIYRLEFEGWSKQAPTGWVRTAVERTKQIAKQMPRA
jgi:hypothetical protein